MKSVFNDWLIIWLDWVKMTPRVWQMINILEVIVIIQDKPCLEKQMILDTD